MVALIVWAALGGLAGYFSILVMGHIDSHRADQRAWKMQQAMYVEMMAERSDVYESWWQIPRDLVGVTFVK